MRRDRLEAQREMLALVATTGELSSSRYEPRDLPSAITLARMIAISPLCPPALRGREADVLLVMMTGAEMGLTTMQALRNLHVVNGRIGLSAAMIRGRCQKHAECDLFEVAEADATHAVVEVKKRGWSERRLVAWSIADAERAGLIRPESLWDRWPQEMCVARATTRAASMYFPEVTSGVLSEEDLRDMTLPDAPEPRIFAAPASTNAAGAAAGGGRTGPALSALDAFAAAGSHEGLPAENAEEQWNDGAPRSAHAANAANAAGAKTAEAGARRLARKPPKRAAQRARRKVAAQPASRNGRRRI